jgi:hypothetical protein
MALKNARSGVFAAQCPLHADEFSATLLPYCPPGHVIEDDAPAILYDAIGQGITVALVELAGASAWLGGPTAQVTSSKFFVQP